MPTPIVTQILSWTKTYRDAADKAFDAVADAVQQDPTNAAKQLDFKQAVQNHTVVLNNCGSLAVAAMQVVAANAAKTLASIDDGTAKLQSVLDKIATAQHVLDVLADLVTVTADVVNALATLDPTKVLTVASELKTLIDDTVGGGGGD